uniref:Uncharacterized protein n=1 Tax=Vitis vinifera TaxID=29760 RepID=F6H6S1_VITVI
MTLDRELKPLDVMNS